MTSEKHVRYLFEEELDDSFKAKLKGQIEYFKSEVKITVEPSAAENEAIKEFVYENIMNIKWYKDKKQEEQDIQKTYNKATVAFLLLIPILTFGASYLLNKMELDELITGSSLITVILSTVLGLHKFFSAWIDKRKFLSGFHKAFTELKNILYQIDNKWSVIGAQTEDGALSPVFLEEIREATKQSRAIVSQESTDYFEKLGSPTFDLSNALSSSAKAAKQALKDYQAFDIDKKITKLEGEKAVEEIENKSRELTNDYIGLQNQFRALEARIESIEDEIEQLEKDGASSDVLDQKNNELDALQDQQDSIEWELSIINIQREKLKKKLEKL